MEDKMNSCPWAPIDDFQSRHEFDRFVSWMMLQVAAGDSIEIAVSRPYIGASSFTEKWFKHMESGQVWRLVWPDGPFTGIFEKVDGD